MWELQEQYNQICNKHYGWNLFISYHGRFLLLFLLNNLLTFRLLLLLRQTTFTFNYIEERILPLCISWSSPHFVVPWTILLPNWLISLTALFNINFALKTSETSNTILQLFSLLIASSATSLKKKITHLIKSESFVFCPPSHYLL